MDDPRTLSVPSAAQRHKLQLKHELLEEEKSRRLKAESALAQQKTIVSELQTQLAQLQEHQQRSANVRENIVAFFEGRNRPHGDNLPHTTGAVGPPSPTRGPGKGAAAALSSGQHSASAPTLGSTTTGGVAVGKGVGFTQLAEPARVGDTRLHVMSYDGVKKGLCVVIGSGQSTESRIVKGLGSIIISSPLSHDHPAGAPVRFYSPTQKGIAKMHRFVAYQNIRGLLVDDIVPTAVVIAERNIIDRGINLLYAHRPVIAHMHNFEIGDAQVVTSGDIHDFVGLPVDSKFTVSCAGESVSTVDARLGAVELLLLFERLRFQLEHEEKRRTDGLYLGRYIRTSDLLESLSRDTALQAAFQSIAEYQRFATVEAFVEGCEGGEGKIFWDDYFSSLHPFHVPSNAQLTSASSSEESATALLQELHANARGLDVESVYLLWRLFSLLDCDGDETVTPVEAAASFAELDGASTIATQTCFSAAIDRVVGKKLDTQRLTLATFVCLREQYAQLCGTLGGGFRLKGVLNILSIVQSNKRDSVAPLGPASSSVVVSLRDFQQAASLGSNMLGCLVLPVQKPLSVLLADAAPFVPLESLLSIATGRAELHGRMTFSQALEVDHPASEEHGRVEQGRRRHRICQLLTDHRRATVYALSETGVVYAYDATTNRPLYQQRVIWAEGLPVRAVESNERFQKWRRESCLNVDSESVEAALKASDTISISAQLALLTASLPTEAGGGHVLSLDEETGLLVVNACVVSGSLCFHEPTSLRRLYRIRTPAKLSDAVVDMVQAVSNGQPFRATKLSYRECNGIIAQLILCASKSIMIASIAGSKSIHVLSMLTGDTIVELAGHLAYLTALQVEKTSDLVFSGSADNTVRVWRASECIPHRLATVGSLDDPALNQLERRISGYNIGTGSRQAIRSLCQLLYQRINLAAKWRRGKITAFFDGNQYLAETDRDGHSPGVEVLHENGTVQIYSNVVQLRDPYEATSLPLGPPAWSSPSAPLLRGQNVAVFDVDPDEAVCMCARAMGISSTASYTYDALEEHLVSLVESEDGGAGQLGGRLGSCDVGAVLVAIGVRKDLGGRYVLHSILRRIFTSQDKFTSRCDRLLASNSAPIVSIHFVPSSKLLVTIDKQGDCCVWDPCLARVCLAFRDSFDRPAFVGRFPYSLVAKSNIISGLQLPYNSSASASGSYDGVVCSARQVDIPTSPVIPFPLCGEAISRALAADKKFASSEISTKAIVYVMKDLATIVLETACFLPGLVTLSNADTFFSGASEHIVAVDAGPAAGSGLATATLQSSLQQVWNRRDDVLRIVYAVSCTHESATALVGDLTQYGVLQRGYTITPSELVEVACFERPSRWFERASKCPSSTYSAVKFVPSPEVTGIVTLLVPQGHDLQVTVALDFSNEVVVVSSSRVSKILERHVQQSHLLHSDGAGANQTRPSTSELAVGCRVSVARHKKDLDELMIKSKVDASKRSCGDVILVNIKFQHRQNDEIISVLVPVTLGRTSFPTTAGALAVGPTIDELSRKRVSASYMASLAVGSGRLCGAAYLRTCAAAAWGNTVITHASLVLREASASVATGSGSTGSGSTGSMVKGSGGARGLVTSSGHQADFGMTSEEPGFGSKFSWFQSMRASHISFVLQLYLVLTHQRASPSHPLVAYLSQVLGPLGAAVAKASAAGDKSSVIQELRVLEKQWLCRRGMHFEEIVYFVTQLKVSDIETLLYRLQPALQSQLQGGSRDDSRSSRDALGPLTLSDMILLLKRAPVDALVAAGHIDSGAGSAVLDEDESTNFLRLVLDHHLLDLSKRFRAVQASVSANATVLLQSRLQSIAQSLVHGVEGAPQAFNAHMELSHLDESPPLAPNGMYSVSSTVARTSQVPGLTALVAHAMTVREDDTDTRTFLVWKYDANSMDTTYEESLNQSTQLMAACQRELPSLVRFLGGISFTGSLGAARLTVLEWDDGWQPLSQITRQGGLLQPGRMELFRILATNLLNAVSEFSDQRIILRALNPHTVIVDSHSFRVRIIALPVAHRMDSDCSREPGSTVATYVRACASDPVAQSCLPMCGQLAQLSSTSSRIVPGSASPLSLSTPMPLHEFDALNWDNWAYGACLFQLAFGFPLLEASLPAAAPSGPSTASADTASFSSLDTGVANVIMRLIFKLRDRSGDGGGGSSGGGGRTATNDTTSSGNGMSQLLHEALDDESRNVVFDLVSRSTGQSVAPLGRFRSQFCTLAASCGLSSWAMGGLWEAIVQKIYFHLRTGRASVNELGERILVAMRPSAAVTLEAMKSMTETVLGLDLTTQELQAMLTSLQPAISASQLKPFPELATAAMKTLVSMLLDLQMYGFMQQLLYVLGGCLSSDPRRRLTWDQMQKLSMFGQRDDTAVLRAKREAELLLQPYYRGLDFLQSVIVNPFVLHIGHFLSRSVEESSMRSYDIGAVLTQLSTIFGQVEELIALATFTLGGKEYSTSGYLLAGNFLRRTGVNMRWLQQQSVEIVASLASQQLLEGLVMFTLRLLGTSAAQTVGKYHFSTAQESSAAEAAMQGLSLGSLLLMRVTKFIQHVINDLHSMSRCTHLSALVEHSTQRAKAAAHDRDSLVALEGADVDREVRSEVAVSLERRTMVEKLYAAVLQSSVMLLLGEECPAPVCGPPPHLLQLAYVNFLPAGTAEHSSEGQEEFFTETRWNSQVSYPLFSGSL